MSSLSITLFGTFQAMVEERPVTFSTEKCRALLAYLAVEAGRPHRRDALAALFWSEQPQKTARSNLRQTLYRLRMAVSDTGNSNPHFLVSAHDIQLNPAGDHWLDVADFERCLETFRDHCGHGLPLCANCHEALKTGAALYRGDFMAGFSIAGSSTFELWLVAKQEEYRRQALDVIGRLGGFYEETGDFARAAECARRLVSLEPWRESSHRLLMRNLAQAGQKRAALAQYDHCRQLMAEDLGIEPSNETQQLYERIRDQEGSGIWGRKDRETAFTHSPPHPYNPAPRSRTPFVGRENEMSKLEGQLARVLAGQGRVLFIHGEAGSGKTTLAAAFCRQALTADESLLVTYGRCDDHFGLGDPYQPFREALRLLSGQAGGDLEWLDAEKMPVKRLQAANPTIKKALAEAGPDLLGTLLLDTNNLSKRPARSDRAGLLQTTLFEQVTGILLAVARSRPLILVLDDLHWIDAASAGLLFHLGRHLAGSRLLIAATYRPEEVDWFDHKAREISRHPLLPVVNELQRLYGDIQIDLDQADGRAFIDAYLDSEPNRLDEGFRDRLYQQTGGNPLFTVEIVRGLQNRDELVKDEAGRWQPGRELNWEQLPARVDAVITERLARLASCCQATISAASVQGQTFLAEVAAGVQGNEPGPVVRCLSEVLGHKHHLVEAASRENYDGRMVSRFRFRHHLFQQFAYKQLDEIARSRLHEATGLALEEIYAGQSEDHAAELARHFEAAGIVYKAVDYLLAAGESAYHLSANVSALSCFSRALNLLEESPPGPNRDRTEMSLCLAQTAPVLALRGYTAPEIREAANRVIVLAEPLGEADYLFPARLLLLNHYAMLAEYRPALKLGEQLLRHAEREQNSLHLTQAHHMLGYLQFCAGSFRAALHHFNSALSSTDRRVESLLLPGFIGRNMGLTSLFRKAWTLWFLGYPNQSLTALEETMIRVEQLGQDHDLAFTLAIGICPLLYLQREFDQAETQASRLLKLAARKSLHYFIPFGQISLGAALVKRGQIAEGQSKIRSGIQQYRESGQKTFLSFSLSILIDSLGEDEEAGEVLDLALELVEKMDERFFEAELWRQHGEFLGRQGAHPDEVEACFHQALDIARSQEAKALDLRAATSLARFWQGQGRLQEARTLLTGALGWFTEGFETFDLQEAQTLLIELRYGCSTFPVGGQEGITKESHLLQDCSPGQD